jgi:hypothetical protein
MENFEPSDQLPHQKKHCQSRGPRGQPKKSGSIVSLQVTPRDFERHAAGQQDRSGRPKNGWNLEMSPIQSFTGAQKKYRDQSAKRHRDGRKRHYYRQNRSRV